MRMTSRIVYFLFALILATTPSFAERIPSHCLAFAEREPQIPIQYASSHLAKDEVGLRYIAHSMYEITSHGGMRMVTDFNGAVNFTPDLVTMNHAHNTHWTRFPDPKITHVLHGWGEGGEPAFHELELDEVLVRNVTTDIASEFTGIEPDGNSIFIFEIAGLCIGHLGHLHHEPTDAQYGQIGRLDIVMANVDGGMSLSTQTMIRVMKRLRASVVLPMHWWGRFTLDEFLNGLSSEFAVEEIAEDQLVMSLDLLPRKPTVYVMQPRFVEDFE